MLTNPYTLTPTPKHDPRHKCPLTLINIDELKKSEMTKKQTISRKYEHEWCD